MEIDPSLEKDVLSADGLIESGSALEVINYLKEGNATAAIEILEQNGHLQHSCMNALKGEHLFKLAKRCWEYT